jgi:hypothetical protein
MKKLKLDEINLIDDMKYKDENCNQFLVKLLISRKVTDEICLKKTFEV